MDDTTRTIITEAYLYDADHRCRVCGSHRAEPHKEGCPRGAGFADMSIDTARGIAAGWLEAYGQPGADLHEYEFAVTVEHVITGETLHAVPGQLVLVNPAGQMLSLVTGDLLDVPAGTLTAPMWAVWQGDADGGLLAAPVESEYGAVQLLDALTQAWQVEGFAVDDAYVVAVHIHETDGTEYAYLAGVCPRCQPPEANT